jgi:hypothetical protein
VFQLAIPSVDPNENKKIYMALMLTMGVMFGIVLTVIGIVLELAAGKFTGSVSSIFFRDWRVLGAVGFVVASNVLSFLIFLGTGSEYSGRYAPRSSVVIATILVVFQIIGVFPFMSYLFLFLDSQKVVGTIVDVGLAGVIKSVSDSDGNNVELYQSAAIKSIEHLRDTAQRAIKKVFNAPNAINMKLTINIQRDKNIASKAVDALCSFQLNYGR